MKLLLSSLAGLILVGSSLSVLAQPQVASPTTVIDDCAYASDAAARALWEPMHGSKAVATAMFDGQKALRLPCDFAGGKIERASWDRKVNLDLSRTRGIQFKMLCRKASPMSYFSIYFQSGDGWYYGMFFLESSSDWYT